MIEQLGGRNINGFATATQVQVAAYLMRYNKKILKNQALKKIQERLNFCALKFCVLKFSFRGKKPSKNHNS